MLLTAVAVSAVMVGACSSAATPASSVAGGAHASAAAGVGAGQADCKGKQIAFLMPETKVLRWDSMDKPAFIAKVQAISNCQVDYYNANGDPNEQKSQADSALAKGDAVFVIAAVDSAAASSIADEAAAKNVPVIAYDRMITGSSHVTYYVSFDNVRVGKLEATGVVDKLKAEGKSGGIVMIDGSPTDNNAKLVKEGAHSVIDTSGFPVLKEYDTPGWSPDAAQSEMSGAIAALGKNGFIGVYAANDGTAGGAIAAMIQAGIDPSTIPTSGQDAQLDAIQRILKGTQYMTVYKPIKLEADPAAMLAVDLATGTPVPASMTNGATVNNGRIDVPSILLTPIPVTKDGSQPGTKSVKDSVVADGFWTVAQICTPDFADACKAVGLQ
jgi:D-xylose transport system substrate-binding protein